MFENTKNNLYLAFCSSFSNLTWKRLQIILEKYPDFYTAFKDNFSIIDIDKLTWIKPIMNISEKNLEKFEIDMLTNKINLLAYTDSLYPTFWKHLTDPPIVMYTQGNPEALITNRKLTVVGSRRLQTYTQRVCDKILKPVCEAGVVTVSGLAFGVDALAHQTSLKSKTPTIAIIGSGLDEGSFYPSQNFSLKQQIIDNGGLVMSEYPVGTKGLPFYFPKRNRLLATLTDITLVLQAGCKSGTLVTASLVQEYGKTLATVPASILDPNYQGNIELIRDGAQSISCAEDLFGLLGLSTSKIVKIINYDELEPLHKDIYLNLSSPSDIDGLAMILNMPTYQLVSVLSIMELKGLVIVRENGIWERLY